MGLFISVFFSISAGIDLHSLFPDYILKWVYAPVLNMTIYKYISKYSHSAELEFKSVQMEEWRKKIQKKT
jgi:uncharacterized phage-associated protein